MIDSPLMVLAQRRLESLDQVDRVAFPEESLEQSPLWQRTPPSIIKALTPSKNRPKVLFEVKKASPSKGKLSDTDALELCNRYVQAGAPAISVLVDSVHFQGHPRDLEACCLHHADTPFLFKDFVATPYQVRLAKALGSSSVLLMTQLLEKHELEDLYCLSQELSLTPFVETHHQDELEYALELKAPMIGINARDFSTEGLPVDLNTTPNRLENLTKPWPEKTILVAQSGLYTQTDLELLLTACPTGLPHAVQIGSSLSEGEEVPDWLSDLSP